MKTGLFESKQVELTATYHVAFPLTADRIQDRLHVLRVLLIHHKHMSGQLHLERIQQVLVQVGEVLRVDAREESNGRNDLEQGILVQMGAHEGRRARCQRFPLGACLISGFVAFQRLPFAHVVFEVVDRLDCHRVEQVAMNFLK